jgi:hypothetical protein
MADDPKPPVNEIPPVIYPAHSATSDMPPLDDEPVAVAAEPVAEPAEPAAEPAEPVAAEPAKRGRPSKADREISDLKASVAQLTQLIETRLVGSGEPKAAVADAPAAIVPGEPRPKRADFNDPDEYDDAVDAWRDARDDQRVAAREAALAKTAIETAAESAKKSAETENQKIIDTWQSRRSAAVEKYEDYEEIAESKDTQFTIPMLHAVINSEYGPDIAYWLGKNQKESARIAAMTNPIHQALAIGRIEAAFAAAPVEPEPKEPEPVVVQPRSNAPRPIRPVTPRSEPVEVEPTEENSESRIGKMVEELRRQNQSLGWGTVPSGAQRVN